MFVLPLNVKMFAPPLDVKMCVPPLRARVETKCEMFEEVTKNTFSILLDAFTEEYIENDNIDNVEPIFYIHTQ